MKPAPATTLDLDRLALSPGEGRRLQLPVPLGAIELAGQEYRPVPAISDVTMTVSRTASGHGFKHSPAIGEAVAQLVTRGRSDLDVARFALARGG